MNQPRVRDVPKETGQRHRPPPARSADDDGEIMRTDPLSARAETGSGRPIPELELAGWRREISELYAAVRADEQPRRGHELWRRRRDELFGSHPQSPLPPGDPLRTSGLPYWPYDPL
jgi:hypothetical protein